MIRCMAGGGCEWSLEGSRFEQAFIQPSTYFEVADLSDSKDVPKDLAWLTWKEESSVRCTMTYA